ncbi:MAG: hypothetical protein HYR97_05645, partial [Candidatus Melainabacteria bacterium]|nr:hypothetical protein [Candidatus Melainabacteria bacterium]
SLKQVILVIYTGNDLICTGRNVCYGKRKPLFIIKDNDLILANENIKKYCLRNLFSKSYFLGKFFEHTGAMGKLLSRISGDKILDAKEATDISLNLLQRIYELTLSHGADLLVILSPAKDDFTEKSPSLNLFQYAFRHTKLKKLNHIDYIEILKKENELDSLYLDTAHFSKTGNLVLAKTIYEHLHDTLRDEHS